MFICKPNTQNIFAIKSVLRCFDLKSGLKVNFNKSRIGGTWVDSMKLQRFAAILSCKVESTLHLLRKTQRGKPYKEGLLAGDDFKNKEETLKVERKTHIYCGKGKPYKVSFIYHALIILINI